MGAHRARALYLEICRALRVRVHGYPIDLATRNLTRGRRSGGGRRHVGPMAVWIIGSLAGAIAIGWPLSCGSASQKHSLVDSHFTPTVH